jgi:hypothetical protein
MRNIIFIFILGLILASCKREENTPVEPLMETVDSMAVVNVKRKLYRNRGRIRFRYGQDHYC